MKSQLEHEQSLVLAERKRQARREAKTERRCASCGEPFAGRSTQRYCGYACSNAARRLPAATCAVCGSSFQPRFRLQKACSPECATALRKDAASRPRPGRRVVRQERKCETCGKVFEVETGRKEKYCSRACWRSNPPTESDEAAERKRSTLRQRRGNANPNFRHGGRSGVRDRSGERRWYAAGAAACENPRCDGRGGVLALHHVVYKQHVEREGGDVWAPENALTLCERCHARHHRRSLILRLADLRPANIQFAFALFGARAADYLRRYYDCGIEPELLRTLEAEYRQEDETA